MRRPTVSSTQVDNECILVDHNGAAMIMLNEVGGMLWERLATAHSIEELVTWCHAAFPSVARSTIAIDTEAFLSQVIELDLVQSNG